MTNLLRNPAGLVESYFVGLGMARSSKEEVNAAAKKVETMADHGNKV